MRNAMVVLGVVLGGSALFLGSVLAILSFQGRLEGESLRQLSQNPLLGAFLPAPEPLPPPKAEEQDKGETGKGAAAGSAIRVPTGGEVPVYLNAPKGFSPQELTTMLQETREDRARTEQEWAAIEREKLNLTRLQEDLAERKSEVERAMSEVLSAQAELKTAREEFRKEILTVEESEDKMIRKLAELYENMKPVETAAEHFNEMDLDQAVKILVRMDASKAAKILPYVDAERVKVLTEKLSRFQERKTTTGGR